MTSDEMSRLLSRVHKDISIIDFEGKKIPCISLDGKRFDEIMKLIAGKPVSVETNLNILQDGQGHVFVEIVLTFSVGSFNEKLLLYANNSMDFFESLENSTLLALSASNSEFGESHLFMIQLPKKDRILTALEIIRKGIKKN